MHEQSIKTVLLKEEFDQLLPILFAAERWFNVKYGAHRRCQLQFFAEVEVSQCLKAFPILNETVFEDALWIATLLCEGLVKIQLRLFPCLLVQLHILSYERRYRRCDDVGAVLPCEANSGVERTNFHDERDTVEMVKPFWNVHYLSQFPKYIKYY
jgi:hypothetical protein